MRNREGLLLSSLLLTASLANAATYHVSGIGMNLAGVGNSGFDSSCQSTLYDPEVYTKPDGHVILWGQGGSVASCSKGIDSIYSVPNQYGDVWTNPTLTTCAPLRGNVVCDQYVTGPDPSGPVASPSVVKVGTKYYMAYVAGNADLERGRINWAVSTDGVTFNKYPNNTTPVSIITPIPTSKTACQPHGIGQVQLVYESGYFYFLFEYYHFQNANGGPFTTLAYRINYDSTNAFGLGTTRQIYQGSTNSWVAHDGNLRFTYDGGTLPISGNYDSRGFAFAGEADVKWDPSRSRWIHVYSDFMIDKLYWQETTSLATGTWSAQVEIDTSVLRSQFPTSPFIGSGLWYGDIWGTGTSRMTLFTPVHYGSNCAAGPFAGLGINVATLDFY